MKTTLQKKILDFLQRNHTLTHLAKFRVQEPFQTIIEVLQVIGIGVWILADVWDHFAASPPDPQRFFSMPNGFLLYLGAFFIADAVLILNAKVYRILFEDTILAESSEIGPNAEKKPIAARFRESSEMLGPNHPVTLKLQRSLVTSLLHQNEHSNAIELSFDLVHKSQSTFGEFDRRTLEVEDFLCHVLVFEANKKGPGSIDDDHLAFIQDLAQTRTLAMPPGNIHLLRIEDYLAEALTNRAAGSMTSDQIRGIIGCEKRSPSIDTKKLDVEPFDKNALIRAVTTFVLDCMLIVVAAPLRAFRVVRPLMILRRMAIATEKEPNWRFPLLSRETFLMTQLAVLLVYSLGLTVIAVGDLIYTAEACKEVGCISEWTLTNSIWYSVQQITLTGGQLEPVTEMGKIYSVLLLFMGLGIIGLFGMLFQRIFGMSFLPKQINHKKLLED